MNQAGVHYLMTRRVDSVSERGCCEDVPAGYVPRSELSAPRRWAMKLREAVPASLSVFRRSLRTPVDAPSPSVGDRVLTQAGLPLGRVEDVLIGLRSGRATYAVTPHDPEAARGDVLLVPREALRDGVQGDVVILDERSLRGRERRTGARVA